MRRREFIQAGGAVMSIGLLVKRNTGFAAVGRGNSDCGLSVERREGARSNEKFDAAQAEADAALSHYVDLAQFGDDWVDVGCFRMHYKFNSARRDTATKVILVHGLGLSYRYMLPTAQALMDEYDVYAPDLPGFGDSSKPEQILDMNALGDSLAGWLDTMRLRGKLVLLGNSMGCQVIAAALDRHPGVAHAAVLQGPITPPEERGVGIQFIRWRQNVGYNPPEMKPISRADYQKCGYRRVWGTFLLSLKDRMEERAGRIAQPALVVRGERDPICNEAWATMLARRLLKGQLAHLPGVAHTLVISAPRELAQVTTDFVRGI